MSCWNPPNGIRTSDSHGFNKGRSSKFREGSQVRQTPEEGRRTYRPKRNGGNNKDEDNSLKTFNDKNHQAISKKFRQLIKYISLDFIFTKTSVCFVDFKILNSQNIGICSLYKYLERL